MAFDSKVMAAVVAELNQRLLGGRITKIYQPEPDELTLLCYASGENYRLLLSAHPRHARVHLTQVEKRNPPTPPMFCMLMRKYTEGGRITAIEQAGRDRICRIAIRNTDELGNPVTYLLVAEVMGKHSNIVLINPEGRIVDAIRRVTEEVNRHRELLPGLPYIPPPATGKLDPGAVTADDLTAADPQTPAWQALLDRVDGLGPLLAREAVWRAGAPAEALLRDVDPARLAAAARELADARDWAPRLLFDPDGRLKEFHVLPLQHWPGRAETGFGSVSACVDAYFGQRAEEERFRSLRGSLSRLVRDEIARVRRKLQAQEESLARAESAETYRLQGELITANLWQIARGMTEVRVVNYYDPEGSEMVIPLDPALSPAENAQAYYRRYQRARSGLAAIQEQLARSRAELAYLEQVEVALEQAESWPDLEEVRRELAAEGYLRDGRARRGNSGRLGEGARLGDGARREDGTGRGNSPRRGNGARNGAEAGLHPTAGAGRGAAGGKAPGAGKAAIKPITLRSSDGLEIWIGRNNRQNDYLTLKLANPHDLWFHTKDIPGSHVILRVPPGKEVPERSLLEAAALAAYHSKARQSSGVPVDYTARKHVRKPSGARPGMVIYDNHKTLWVTPDPEVFPILRRGWSDGAQRAGETDPESGRGDRHRDGHPEGAPGSP